ncbi:hypothetical protein BUALT_Bualt05G0068500 [Buddleja alternifolia]|uniref:Transmembrane protein n=1 Tax=Buddleja alternifolia TaxID=168488 RepID=A0AAV6XIQ9_9LAMI|nr:hypothetical protein BUALT_Bualt05G0068500 [Buddleja alternifolia]
MKFVWQLIFLFFISLLIILVFSVSSSYCNFNGFTYSRIFVFSVFNIVIFSVHVKYGRESSEDFDGLTNLFGSVYEMEEEEVIDNDEMSSDSYDDTDAYSFDSGGYDSEIEWSDDEDDEDDDNEEEDDEDLRIRSDEFIDRMIRGWRQELVMENLNSKHQK